MKKLLWILCFILFAGGAYSQADSLAKPMNGYYLWNGQQFYVDTAWADTSMFDVSNGKVVLTLDTVGSSASGYYRISAQRPAGTIKGTGAANAIPVMVDADSIRAFSNLTYDPITNILLTRRIGNPTGVDDVIIYSGNRKRLTVDSTKTIINENFTSAADVFVLSPTDTLMSMDVSANRIGVNTKESNLGAAALTVTTNASDVSFMFREVPTSVGVATPIFNNAPFAGSIRWMNVKFVIGGVEINGVIPVVFE